MPFHALGLRAELVRAVSDQGYDVPTPVQREAIPLILERRDILAGAQTGTGKTAGFVLPLLQLLMEGHRAPRGRQPQRGPQGFRPVRALILTPTRELADQVEQSVRAYGQHLPLRSTAIYGGVGFGNQIAVLRRGVDIVVATPGRLLDHVGRRTIDLSRVEILVLDEADRMLDMGFIHDIRKVLALLPAERQNLLFSATFSDEIRELAGAFLKTPAQVQVAPRNAPADLVAHMVHPVDSGRKRALLAHLVDRGAWQQVLVFTRTKHGADRLARQLGTDGIAAQSIHGNKSQGARTKALRDFKQGRTRVLVATDIAARGLDIDQLPHVVNYELPHVPEDYVHRIGRTGRAGNEGSAVSLVCAEEHPLLHGIERLLRRDLPRQTIVGFEPDPSLQPKPAVKTRSSHGGATRVMERTSGGPRKPAGSRQPSGSRPGAAPGAGAPRRHSTRRSEPWRPEWAASSGNGNPTSPPEHPGPRGARPGGRPGLPARPDAGSSGAGPVAGRSARRARSFGRRRPR